MATSGVPQTPHDRLLEEIKKLEEIKYDDETTVGRYLGALVLVAGITPLFFLAWLVTVIVYLSPSPLPHLNPSSPSPLHFVEFLDLIGVLALLNWLGPAKTILFIGLIITLIIWLLLAIPCKRFASAKGGRSSDYDGLKTEYTDLKNRLQYVGDQATQDAGKSATPTEHAKAANSNKSTEHAKARDIALADVLSYLGDFAKTLQRNGLNWVLYTGYVIMWDRINKANEAMIDLMPLKTEIETAMYDNLRLDKSDVLDNAALITNLEADINTLRPLLKTSETGSSATKPSTAQSQTSINSSNKKDVAKKPKKTADKSKDTIEKPKKTGEEAISDIRNVRSTIHTFNNERWNQLVRARNQLMGTAFLTAFFIYILLVIAILASVPRLNIEQAIVFYFLGAIVGLFSRLYTEWNSKDPVKDDYGLSMARILVTPLLSGLAALVGVLLFTSASGTIAKIYEFNLQNLVLAAVLGYAPNTVIDKLQANQQKIHGEITSTTVADQGSASSGAGKGSGGGNSNK
jgi:hypothetical protein